MTKIVWFHSYGNRKQKLIKEIAKQNKTKTHG